LIDGANDMQIILLEKVVNLGQLGDVVRVKDGFARNYLIPKGKARRATEAAKKEFEGRRAELEKVQGERLAAARATGDKLEGATIRIAQKAGVDGRLFGSVTNHDVAAALAKQGFPQVEKSMVRMPNGPLKAIGEHKVAVALHSDVTAEVNVTVVAEA
jgi:large subunit ribosomal protein L9